MEMCAFTASFLCMAVKLTSVNVNFTYDYQGNFYFGGQLSVGKSLLPVVSLGIEPGTIFTGNHPLSGEEMRDALSGFSVSAGSIATGGISYSPFADDNNTAFYYPIPPELFSVNVTYNIWAHDFTP